MPNLEKPEARAYSARVAAFLSQLGFPVWVQPEIAREIALPAEAHALPSWRDTVQTAVVLGGDGTLLQSAKLLAPLGIAIIGVNFGNLGFLTELEPEEIEHGLGDILRGEHVKDERMMFQADVMREGRIEQSFLALNDIVVSKGPFSRLIRVEVAFGGRSAFVWPADGVVLATPTGSTAYALSAGGPVLSPEVQAVSVTPICPHSFFARTITAAPSEELRVRVVGPPADAFVTVDGQHGMKLEPGDTVVARAAREKTVLLRRVGWNFYEVLRRKLQEQEGAHAGE